MVSGRVVNTVIASPVSLPSAATTGKLSSAPVLRPIQLACIVRTRSGQPSSWGRSSSSWSA